MSETQQTQTTLASSMVGETPQFDPNAAYLVDFSKLTSVNDLVTILSCMGFTFAGTHPYIDNVKPFLNLDNPIYPGVPKPAPTEGSIKLPKLKPIK